VQLKVLRDIIDNDHLAQISADSRKVLYENWATGESMLSVKSVAYKSLRINLVDDPVCVILHGSCEYDNLIVFVHLLQKLTNPRSNETLALISLFKVVNKSFVQI